MVNDTQLICHDVPAAAWQGSEVSVSLMSQQVSAQSLLTILGAPRVTGVVPATVPTSGGINVTVFGTSFGESRDVAQVLVGTR